MRAQFAGITHAGGRREVNEDAILMMPPVFAVADGMGGHQFGAFAARTVTEHLAGLAALETVGPDDVREALWSAQSEIRAALGAAGGGKAGSTAAGLIVLDSAETRRLLAFNVGDSRIYRSGPLGFEQVSQDHSLVAELVRTGGLTPQEAREHPQRNVITRAVGSGPNTEPDFWMITVRPGERFLLCTDGLIHEVDQAQIAAELAAPGTVQEVAEALVDAAVTHTAQDNVSVVVLEPAGTGFAHAADEHTRPRSIGAAAAVPDGLAESVADTVPRSAVASGGA